MPVTCNPHARYIITSSKPLEQLELLQKRILKQILSLPMSCPDPAVYILTGILPIEAQIHIKALTFFNNVCHQGEKNTEKKLARRELTMKGESSNSWFICVNKILRKYDLKEAYNYLDNPIKTSRWISLVKSSVNDHWCTQLTTLAQLYKGLQYLSNHNLSKCKIHPILKHRCYSSLDISRIPVKLRFVTGTYVLQTKRIKYYRNETDPTCLLCGAADENVLHFILQCEKLQSERVALLSEINAIWQNEFQNNENFTDLRAKLTNYNC